MKNKKLGTLVGSLALVAALGVGATLAYFTDSQDVTNTITMGNVDIDLDEPNYPGEGEDNEITDITPNQTIVKDPTITLQEGSEDAYVRAKITYSFASDTHRFDADEIAEKSGQLEAGMDILSQHWVKGDEGYYYFQGILTDEEGKNTIQLFRNVTIPEDWGNEVANATIQIIVEAEAIQADNFTPERNELNEIVGWNNVTPETYNN